MSLCFKSLIFLLQKFESYMILDMKSISYKNQRFKRSRISRMGLVALSGTGKGSRG